MEQLHRTSLEFCPKHGPLGVACRKWKRSRLPRRKPTAKHASTTGSSMSCQHFIMMQLYTMICAKLEVCWRKTVFVLKADKKSSAEDSSGDVLFPQRLSFYVNVALFLMKIVAFVFSFSLAVFGSCCFVRHAFHVLARSLFQQARRWSLHSTFCRSASLRGQQSKNLNQSLSSFPLARATSRSWPTLALPPSWVALRLSSCLREFKH